MAWLAVVAAPLYETLLAQAVPLEITHRMKLPWAWGIAGSALVFGLAHWLGGGVGHGVVTLFIGAVFAAMYAAFRGAVSVPGFGRGGLVAAYGVAAGTHAVHNGLALWLVH
jgi:membrane protease YdiL (CAAX protease family)